MRFPVQASVRWEPLRRNEPGGVAFADYRLHGGVLTLLHVEAPPALRGSGAAGRLMAGLLQSARDRGLEVSPLCGYAEAFMRRHPEWDDLRV